MTEIEVVAGRPVELERIELEAVRVRILPGGRMDSNNAARYLNRAIKTLAMWRLKRVGPKWAKCRGRVFYLKDDLDAFVRGETA